MLQALTAGVLFLSSLASPASSPASPAKATPPPSDKMTIALVGLNGSGCAPGTASVLTAQDNTAFTVLYSEYTAQAGKGAAPDEFRRNCQIALNVQVPSGYTYAIAKTDYRGYLNLAPGAWALQQANYYFQGYSQTARARHNFNSGNNGDWQTTDLVGLESYSWAPCGEKRYLNINTELRVGTGSSNGQTLNLITMDSTDTAIGTIYHLAWKRC
ncbi:DUF4360 domain-containing protein [Paractinoplanes durhamensis]|uniref:DUF4360 domain-containing protein n=1 Tax=Paractinoplanes durhamensis TaxID=113563 RepID=A0ABQ3Z999_9ACTN|nr:DUF4360 domain-containing protein [Actinoplanes durhamensis]GIE06387.1 hypothetical protein Adu01nite_77370 [Actinoplanes durhamensis]